jgi:hypothetical protein
MRSWEDKAHRLVSIMCRREYERSNRLPNGMLRKKYVPYSVPEDARMLVECLGMHDRQAAELKAKQFFLSHDGMALL